MGYDVRTQQPIAFGAVAEMIRESIQRDYHLSQEKLKEFGGDALSWGQRQNSNRRAGPDAFRARYP